MTISEKIARGGFADPVFAAQTVFRAVMDAMARPGAVHGVSTDVRPPSPLNATAAAVALTLADADTPLWLGAELARSDAVRGWLSFHTAVPFAEFISHAGFAIVANPANVQPLSGFALGTQEYPDRSTTIIMQVETLTSGAPMTLSGPGIKGSRTIAPHPMPGHFKTQWRDINGHYPRGVDLVLASENAIACLPRTTRIGEREV
ncbi:phosphonate C-P lyase system protein PhnH [Oricola cellulosilytica]|uniref:Phosphonate C-P lyase system protein PhnH n=1 Tax=Oricola cellulosilytica TaxID=1429082 RepID=A0A4R0PBQ2_9HYPH|nr:phosphonate C-P lyase system protein PhnH [Oricola cellulosilytica]TCD13367.1 phosphonate C-P lyase system protein PhnH [Oricola cellulosilytica]